ncbi:MAG: calcium/sodium antiporter [Azonexus sp.]|nr:calcium/sodium antiporter [Azonexus sp.]
MSESGMNILFFILGLVTLIGGAELLVRGASRLSLSFGISPLVVGLTVVAFGTSAPEMAVSVQSAMTDRADIALGNVIGSNIMNVLLILGASAMIVPLVVANQLIRQEVPVMVGFSLLLLALSYDGKLSPLDGLLLIVLFLIYTVVVVRQSRRQLGAEAGSGAPSSVVGNGRGDHWTIQLLLVGSGLGLLVLGAHWLVGAAVAFANHLGISELVIGLTVVAVGTSLPEVATSLMAAFRGERDIAGVLGVTSLVAPTGIPVHLSILSFDLPVMIAVAVACLPIFFTGNLIARWEGGLFLSLYAAYLAYVVLAAQKHDALTAYGSVLAGFVLPIIAVTLILVSWREWHVLASTRRTGVRK